MDICPCWGCDDRNAECHSVCEGYLGWSERNAERKRQIFVERLADVANAKRACDTLARSAVWSKRKHY